MKSKQIEAIKLEIEQKRAEAALKNADAKQAELLLDVADCYRDRLSDQTLYGLVNEAAKILTGHDLIIPRHDSQEY